MDFDRDTSAGYLANHMARLFARALEARLRRHGLALGAFPALLQLWEQDGLTQTQLVERLDIEQPTMAATLSRMERDGLVTRHRDPGDARVQHVHLSPLARRLREHALADAAEINALALKTMSQAERDQFIALMQRVIAALHPTAG